MTASVSIEEDEERPLSFDGPRDSAGGSAVTEPTVPEDDRLPLDVVFGLLSNERRRRVLHYLEEGTEATTLSDLAEHVAAVENDKPERELTSSERKRVYICLYQVHLPKMDDADVIDYDRARGTVELRPAADQLLGYLALDPHGTDRTGSWLRALVPAPLLGLGARLLGWISLEAGHRR